MNRFCTMMRILALIVFLTFMPALAAQLVNINTASEAELTTLPGIGPSTAASIIDYRTLKPFDSLEELLEVKGIGPAKFEAIKDLISIDGLGEGAGVEAE